MDEECHIKTSIMCGRNSENSIWISCMMIFIIRTPEFYAFFAQSIKHMNELLMRGGGGGGGGGEHNCVHTHV
jgi:hypothetical protein